MTTLPFSTDAVLESLNDGFQAFDREWRYAYLNRRAEQILGRTREELLGKVCWEEYPEAVGTEFHANYLRAMESGQPVVFEMFCPHEKRWAEFSLHPYSGGLGAFTRDITERKEADEALRHAREEGRAAEALRASEERFRLLVEGVKDYAIFLLDPEGYITTWNTGAERAKGYKPEEIIGQHFSRFYTPEDIARRHPWNELEIAKREGSYEEEGWRVRKDGSRFWANVLITALRDEKGQLRGFAKVTRDVTERREREREQAVAARAEQQRRLLRDVLASVTEGRLILCDNVADLPKRLPIVEGAGDEPVLLTEHALRLVRKRTIEAARVAGLDKDQGNGLLTAVGEATMNAVTHAREGKAYVGVDTEAGRVQVWVEDKGNGIDMSRLPQATLEHGYSTAGTLGHGFKLMLQTADQIWLLTGSTGTTVVLEQGREVSLPNWLTEI